jgi:N-acetylglutamate synthase-like GNAT family acetyltransferase
MEVRQAGIEDLDSLANFDEVARRDRRRVELLAEAIEAMQCYVCQDGSNAVGYGVLDYSWYDCGFIRLLYVHPGHRRRSVGSTLLRAMEERCRTSKLFTSTNQSNAPMRSLLVKLGYIESGFIGNLDPGDPEVVYFKMLGTKEANNAAAPDGGHDADRVGSKVSLTRRR